MAKSPPFSASPRRAIGDARLSALDLRVLLGISYHDRFSVSRKAGQGCTASHETLAKEVGCHYTNLSTAIGKLVALGYVTKEIATGNKRLRVYRIVPDELSDGKQQLCQTANNANAGEQFARNGAIVCPIVCPPSDQGTESITVPPHNITEENGRDSAKAGRDSVETASVASRQMRVEGLGEHNGSNDGAYLAILERVLRDDRQTTTFPVAERRLAEIMHKYERFDPLHEHAQRLADEIAYRCCGA